tara:strand:- start:291 stop:1796 length:1506 start_codon:yes stop_codon:yes gene_type:complete
MSSNKNDKGVPGSMINKILVYGLLFSLLAACSSSGDGDGDVFGGPPDDEGSSVVTAECELAETPPSRLFLQMLSDRGTMVKWRGDANSLCYSMDGTNVYSVSALSGEGDHKEASISGLLADTVYYYAVGGEVDISTAAHFKTAPENGSLPADGSVKIWIVGDSGKATEDADAVNEGFKEYFSSTGDDTLDMLLMLGDNAYDDGTDEEFQTTFFDRFTDVLLSTPVWATVGNHEMGTSGFSIVTDELEYVPLVDDGIEYKGMPFLDIFSFPVAGEQGGIASGTEQYFSFNYGNVHVVNLDSQLTARDTEQMAAMKQWFIDDMSATLSAGEFHWTIVIFHHPVYTKGGHDSDNGDHIFKNYDRPMLDMREQFVPLFDQYGVDLVYNGHDHFYERSYYLQGHTGLSSTFDPVLHAELNTAGDPTSGRGKEAYNQVTKSGADDRVVYSVVGSSGKLTLTEDPKHPAHLLRKTQMGSVLLDITEQQLDARFILSDGSVGDHFILTR